MHWGAIEFGYREFHYCHSRGFSRVDLFSFIVHFFREPGFLVFFATISRCFIRNLLKKDRQSHLRRLIFGVQCRLVRPVAGRWVLILNPAPSNTNVQGSPGNPISSLGLAGCWDNLRRYKSAAK